MIEGIMLANRYQLLELVDTGGTSCIYKALDTKNNSVVAAKVLKSELMSNPVYVERFKKEVQAALRLKHANIIRSYDAGLDQDKYYIIMDFINGKTLKHIITINMPLPVKFVVNVAKKICLALEYAHVKGFIHRDIKPHNIMIDMEGEPYLTDFGIAEKINQEAPDIEEANVMGSVHYFSPEQARGEKMDKRTDLYSLGIVLYEMLISKVPFDGETSVEIALKHLNQPMPEIIDKTGEIPASLNKIIQKAAQKDRDLRYKSAFAMYEDLNRCLTERDGDYIKLQKAAPVQNPHEVEKTKLKTSRGLRTILVSSLSIMAVIVILILVFNMNFDSSKNTVPVPDVRNATLQTAKAEVEALDLVPNVINTFSSDVNTGLVISQDPQPGTEMKAGQTVDIKVSVGPDLPPMPDVVGMPVQDAKEQLTEYLEARNVEIQNIEVIEQTNGNYPDGTVISQYPMKDDKVKQNDTITLTVKSTSDLKKEAPNVVRQPLSIALNSLKSSGYSKFFIYEVQNDSYAAGTISNQSPEQGVSQAVSQPFTMWVSEYNNVYILNKTLDLIIEDDNTAVTIALKTQIDGTDVYIIMREFMENAGKTRLDMSEVVGLPFDTDAVQAQMIVFINNVAEQTFDVTLQNGG
jgi:serine/threonine protein kinase